MGEDRDKHGSEAQRAADPYTQDSDHSLWGGQCQRSENTESKGKRRGDHTIRYVTWGKRQGEYWDMCLIREPSHSKAGQDSPG